MNKKVCCFGELLLRLSPDTNNNNWLYANTMPFYVGGAELNTATALSCWNIPVKYFTALPDNYLSKQIVQFINEKRLILMRFYLKENVWVFIIYLLDWSLKISV